MKTFQIFLGLVVLMLVLWTAAAPVVNADDKMLIGGVADGCACGDDSSRTCKALEGQSCSTKVTRCNSGTAKKCSDQSGGGSLPCSMSSGCTNERMQTCE